MTATLLDQDTFTRANNASNWGTASGGSTWSTTLNTPTLSIASNEGHATGITAQANMRLGSGASANAEGLVRVKCNNTSSTRMGISLRQTATNTFYHGRLSANANNLVIGKVISGTNTDLFTTAFTVTAGTFYWIRFRAVGTHLYAKAWADGSGEPGAWTLTGTDASISASGGFGLTINASSTGTTWDFDSFQVWDATTTLTAPTRIRLRAQATKTTPVRTLLRALTTRVTTVRTRLTTGGGSSSKSTLVRALLRAQNTRIAHVRAVIGLPTSSRSAPVRALLRAQNTPTSLVRFLLRTTTSHVAQVRLVLSPANTRVAPIRFVLATNSIPSGKMVLFANGTGTVTYDSFRVTEYPDPALSLAPVLPRLGSTLSSWIATTPNSTTLAVKTSLDGVNWSSATNGGTITGLNAQPTPTIDIFTSNTSANYTLIATGSAAGYVPRAFGGTIILGTPTTATFDTVNRRLTLSGSASTLYLYTSVTATDVDLLCDMDESDAGGLVWRHVDANNYYELGAYDDSASGGFTNQLRLYKVASGVRSLLGTASTISWPRSTIGASPYRRIRVTMLGSIITVYLDGVQVQQYTDGSPLSAGLCGLRNAGGTSRYYQLRIQPQGDYVSGTPAGDIVTADFVYTQATLTTSDPSVTPQVTDLNTSARSPQLATGVQIPAFHDPATPFVEFLNTEMDNLALASGDYTWNLATNGALSFAERHATPAPWCLSSSDLKYSGNGQSSSSGAQVTPMGTADLYRNRQNITNCTGLVSPPPETKIADGTVTSWQMAYPLYSAPTITVGGVTQTVGIQGVDTGKAFYWQAKSNSIGQDTSALKIPSGTILTFSYVGQFVQTVTRNNLPEQAVRAAIEGNSGIVEATEDGKGMLVTNATTYADGWLARFGVNNAVQLTGTTTRSGLASGMIVPVFLPEHQLINHQMLITNVSTQAQQQGDGTTLYFYTITATEGANLSNWVKIFKF